MYDGCINATELPALDTSKGTDLRYMYNACKNARVIDISHYNISSTSNSRNWCASCYSLKTIAIRSFGSSYVLDYDSFGGSCHLDGSYNSTHNPYSKKDGYVYVPRDMIETLSTATNWSQLQFRALEDYTKDGTTTGAINHKKIFMEESITFPESQMITETGIKTLSIKLKDFVNIPTVNITSDNEEVVTISNINATTSEITFDVNVLEVQGTANITVSISDDATIEETFTIGHYNYEEPTYSVENITDATYGFKLNSDEYYESTNKGVNNSYSLCKIVINNPNPDNIVKMTLCCKHSSENNRDFGILSNIDTTLELSYSADSSNVYKSFKGIGSIVPMEVSYALPNGEHFIYAKYIKDNSESTGYDSLQFKVMFGANI